ncbi:glycosyltransferase family 4 protein [Marinomonas rhizomae]|uniref:glycosyltransferase family 4 protein n=1 Tax=Marinomonas rhizomae TaxID=491948 RepID=UPI002103AA99|nr:glycosyltransferase family 1 protein [Marinomonas rhizomae]UTW00184.1 glycosyltransferase family 4 protein [Marinomonas rhizomae]
MKIAFDHQTFTYQAYGGVSRYYSILANQLFLSKQNVKVFAGIHQNNYLKSLSSEILSEFKLRSFPPKSSRVFHGVNHIINQFQLRNWKPDILHETYYSSLPSFFSSPSARVTTVYDMIHELFPSQFPLSDNTSKAKRKTLERVDHIISISESTKRDLIHFFGIDESKISVVQLGVSLDAFNSALGNDLSTHDKPFLLYVGSRFGYKNFDGLLKAVASSDTLKSNFDIVAFGGGDFSLEELSLIRSLGFSGSQVRQCRGSDKELATLYSRATAFVYPSLYEGFGLPPLEAMASGCPVITSNTSSMPEVVRSAGVYFNPREIEDIRFAIEHVVFSPTVRSELVLAGFENIKSFSWRKCADETLTVYKKVLGNS